MPPESNNEKLQELVIIITDRIKSVNRAWWYLLAACLILCIPTFFVLQSVFVSIEVKTHVFPRYIYQDETKSPLTVADETIFSLGGNVYDGYFVIKNSTNHDWGVPDQSYSVSFTTTAGTQVAATITKSTYVLPSSEKIIVTPRFTSDQKPTVMNVTLGPTKFVFRPDRPDPSLDIEKTNLVTSGGQLLVTAEVKNKTPFTIKQIDLSALLYDAAGKVVGANYTSINAVLYTENRSFQFSWPNHPNAIRAEILPDVNIYDQTIYQLSTSPTQFNSTTQ